MSSLGTALLGVGSHKVQSISKLRSVLSFSLTSLGLLLLFGASFYYRTLTGGETNLASKFSQVTSSLSAKSSGYVEPSMVAGHAGWYEEKAIFALYLCALFLTLCSIGVATLHRIQHGAYRSFGPLLCYAVVVACCICVTVYNSGLLFSL